MDTIDAIAVESGVIEPVAIFKGSETVSMKETIAIGKNDVEDGVKRKGRNKKKTEIVLTSEGGLKGCTLQVSNNKMPLVFYLNLAKKYINQQKYVELSALGMAITTAVTIAEILKNDGWATEKDITISSVPLKNDVRGRDVRKAKIRILLERTKKLTKDELVEAICPSGISDNETSEFSSEICQKVVETEDQSGTSGSLTKENDPKTVSMELIVGTLTEENDPKTVSMEHIEGSLTEENDPKTVIIEQIDGRLTEENDPKNVIIQIDGSLTEENDSKNVTMELTRGSLAEENGKMNAEVELARDGT